MKEEKLTNYEERVLRVCNYIYQNLDEHLTLEVLSEVAAFSKFHFHRVFVASAGISVIKFIQIARLKRASLRLAFESEVRVIDVALEAGFDSPEAFARSFKRIFGQSPSKFREAPYWPSRMLQLDYCSQSLGMKIMEMDIQRFKTNRVVELEKIE